MYGGYPDSANPQRGGGRHPDFANENRKPPPQ